MLHVWTSKPRFVKLLISLAVFVSLFIAYGVKTDALAVITKHETEDPGKEAVIFKPDWAIVAAKTFDDDVEWIYELCRESGCTPYIYNMDLIPEEGLEVPHFYQGHEASAYLSYIADHYDHLHPYTVFLHGRETQWHNDIAGPETSRVLRSLRFEAIKAYGYVNLRCAGVPGCPSTLHQKDPKEHDQQYQYLLDQLPEILNNLIGMKYQDFPEDIGHQCCAQFALSREQIQTNSKETYHKIMRWIGTTDATDNYGIGWLAEKLWHIIFHMPAVLYVNPHGVLISLTDISLDVPRRQNAAVIYMDGVVLVH
ncbi:hypothetical protein N7495_004043 [Penicillium taxi]|uniref:uncharacterized protein n=1 Tax=Penicillium taxi TaxID=168475 RepID=UPI0025457476|nr:uncharacterized protein N7495_004043 [Penicillium taxi]KAJ5899299.1 hypothetical protein N7495_004043 [Penicillium taxi]